MIDDPRFVDPKAPAKPEKTVVTRDSLFAECLLSLMISITIMSALMIVKTYVVYISFNIYSQYVLLFLVLIHTFIRRSRINNIIINLAVQAAVSAVFYFAVKNMPVLGFGNDGRSGFYLVALVTALTVYSFVHYLRPKSSAADSEIVFIPITVHILGWIFFEFSKTVAYTQSGYAKWAVTRELESDKVAFVRLLVINAVIVAMLYLVMRQLAVFDKKYYHSIQKKSQSTMMLKRQNYITVFFHLAVVMVTFGIILIFPYSAAFSVFSKISTVVFKVFNFFMSLLLKIKTGDLGNDLAEESIVADMPAEDNPLINVILTVVAIIGAAVILCVIMIVMVRLIKNSIKYAADRKAEDDDSVIDIVENIGPLKKLFSRKNHDFGTGYERRIRKQFYDKTRNAMKKGLPVNDASTPGQIESVLLDYGDNEISSLRQEYEDVRYGRR